jgi:hypothetical protein
MNDRSGGDDSAAWAVYVVHFWAVAAVAQCARVPVAVAKGTALTSLHDAIVQRIYVLDRAYKCSPLTLYASLEWSCMSHRSLAWLVCTTLPPLIPLLELVYAHVHLTHGGNWRAHVYGTQAFALRATLVCASTGNSMTAHVPPPPSHTAPRVKDMHALLTLTLALIECQLVVCTTSNLLSHQTMSRCISGARTRDLPALPPPQ